MVKLMHKKIPPPDTTNNHAALSLRIRSVIAIWWLFQLSVYSLLLILLAIPIVQLSTRSALSLGGVISLFAGITLAYGLRPSRWKTSNKFSPDRVHGLRLAHQQVPALAALLERVTLESGFRVPLKMYLVQDSQLHIMTKTNWRSQVKQAYVLIGLGLFGILNEAELAALLTQKIAELHQATVSGSTQLHILRRRARRLIHITENSLFIVDAALAQFARLFLRLSAKLQTNLIFSADQIAADRSGRQIFCNALEKIELMQPMWQAYWQHDLHTAIQHDTYLPIFDGFRRFCKTSPKRAEIQAFLEAFQTEARHQAVATFNTTPPLSARLKALRGKSEPGFPPLADCLLLLGGEATAEVIWYSQYETGLTNTSNWEQYARSLYPAKIRAQFSQHWMNPAKLAFTELINLAYQIDDLWDKNRPANIDLLSPSAKRLASQKILEEWIIACLLQRGFHVHLQPGQSLTMQNHEKTVTPSALLEAALAGTLKSSYLKQFDPTANPL